MQGQLNPGIQSPVVVTSRRGGTKMPAPTSACTRTPPSTSAACPVPETQVEHVIGDARPPLRAGRRHDLDRLITQAAQILRDSGAKSVVIAVSPRRALRPGPEPGGGLGGQDPGHLLDSVPQDRANLPKNMEILRVWRP
ncbi:MAG: hypothetical protein R3E96_03295 [Planctomycetota bacterium]